VNDLQFLKIYKNHGFRDFAIRDDAMHVAVFRYNSFVDEDSQVTCLLINMLVGGYEDLFRKMGGTRNSSGTQQSDHMLQEGFSFWFFQEFLNRYLWAYQNG